TNSTCHNSGWLHNSTLTKPVLTLPNSTFCLSCHGNNGTGGTNYSGSITGYKEKHNNTLNCTLCHLNNSKEIHPVKYRQTDNVTFATSNASAVNCTTCHQGSGLGGIFANATRIPKPMSHSDNAYNGSLWNNTPGYWKNTSQLSSCVYCHTNSSLHNSTGLGKVSQMQYNNTKNQSLTGDSFWCANCHYGNNSYSGTKYKYNGTAYSPVPPNISEYKGITASDGVTSWFNHSLSNYSDAKCKECHGSRITKSYSSEFVHNVSKGGGGPNCIGCHDKGGSGAPDDKRINASDMKLGVHKNLNSNASNVSALDAINKACWACHGSGEQPAGHPGNYKSPYACIDCHNRTSNLTYTTNTTIKTDLNKKKVAEHIQYDYYENISSTRNNSAVNCTFCHNKSLLTINDTASINVRSNVSHYATNTSLVKPTTNCNYCHKNAANASKYYANVTRHPAKTQDVSYCKYCHNTSANTNAISFHSQSLDHRFGNTSSIHGGPGSINYWGFDWEEDDWKETSVLRNDEGCAACHDFIQNTFWICENCHLPDGNSLFKGPKKWIALNDSINDSIPRVYSHTNYSSVNVRNQSQGTASSCFGFGNMTCHGVDYKNNSPAGGYFGYNYLYNDIPITSDPSHFTSTIDRLPNTTRCLFCHNQSNNNIRNAWGNATQVNASTMFNASTNESCYACHTQDNSTPFDFHASTIVEGGGPGCLGCHNISNKQKYTRAYGYIDAVNYSNSIHRNMNKENATVYGINASCWACHNSSGYAVKNNTHPDRRDTPYTCTDCHLANGSRAGAYNATIVEEHFINGSQIRTTNATKNITSCIGCHNKTEMLVSNNDTDSGSFDADGDGTKGGNRSVYHYGKNRTDLRTSGGTATNCSYCHQNPNTYFTTAMANPGYNASISNHSVNYSSSNPNCTQCHNTGWLHNST
ncbi:MAG: hypothetical protein Q8N79_04040, partial [Candidatus Methanoperedens sp.]|nr:hypothetical protein [Candidatus Methanoperedens sp.]